MPPEEVSAMSAPYCGLADAMEFPDETAMTRSDHHSDFGPAQLALFGVAAIVLFFFVWAYVYIY
jgi:hypothetical protein